jgi:GxxExxY protein
VLTAAASGRPLVFSASFDRRCVDSKQPHEVATDTETMNRQDAADAKPEPPEHLDRYAHQVLGAAIEVHQHLGPGFLESVYERALIVELELRGIEVQQQVAIPVVYKDRAIGEARIDLLVEQELVVELKAVDSLLPVHRAQVISYLKAGAFQLGLLINFNVGILKQGVRRVIWNP